MKLLNLLFGFGSGMWVCIVLQEDDASSHCIDLGLNEFGEHFAVYVPGSMNLIKRMLFSSQNIVAITL